MPTVFRRILPHNPEDIHPDTKVTVLGIDGMGFVHLMVDLEEDEGVCWRCGSVAKDPDHSLDVCPVCSGDFND